MSRDSLALSQALQAPQLPLALLEERSPSSSSLGFPKPAGPPHGPETRLAVYKRKRAILRTRLFPCNDNLKKISCPRRRPGSEGLLTDTVFLQFWKLQKHRMMQVPETNRQEKPNYPIFF
jgi:hypothetical protein